MGLLTNCFHPFVQELLFFTVNKKIKCFHVSVSVTECLVKYTTKFMKSVADNTAARRPELFVWSTKSHSRESLISQTCTRAAVRKVQKHILTFQSANSHGTDLYEWRTHKVDIFTSEAPASSFPASERAPSSGLGVTLQK